MERSSQTKRLVGISILSAIIVVLQLAGNFIKVGTFSISLVLIPIVVGAALYGPKAGAWLGGVFGAVVSAMVITGADPGGFVMWSARPFTTIALCLIKGIAAGWVAGLIYQAFAERNRWLGVILAAIAAPVVNTGIFSLSLPLFYKDLLTEWAGGTSTVYFILVGLIGINFLLELGVNLVMSPLILRIIRIRED